MRQEWGLPLTQFRLVPNVHGFEAGCPWKGRRDLAARNALRRIRVKLDGYVKHEVFKDQDLQNAANRENTLTR